MSDSFLNNLLAYEKPLDEAGFNQAVMEKIKRVNKKRMWIMALFSFIGVLLTVVYLATVLPAGIGKNLLTPFNGLLFSSIALFVVWLWTVEMSSD
jgi:uncharacterized membrane protein YfcA